MTIFSLETICNNTKTVQKRTVKYNKYPAL